MIFADGPVAELVDAPDFGSGLRWFESSRVCCEGVRAWRNRYARRSQKSLAERLCGFESHRSHRCVGGGILVFAHGSGPCGVTPVGVRVSPNAPSRDGVTGSTRRIEGPVGSPPWRFDSSPRH